MVFFRRHLKPFAVSSLLVMVFNVLLPNAAWAVTGHASMPEYQSFEPATTTNMVNVFDGSFTYNIPLLEVPNGYPISLSYHSSDVSNEAQASWVGLGWTLNAGAINRAKRGFPDEFKKKEVKYYNNYPANWTVGLNAGLSGEIFGDSAKMGQWGLDLGLAFNNRNGFHGNVGGSASLFGVGLNVNYAHRRLGFQPELSLKSLLSDIRKYKYEQFAKNQLANISTAEEKATEKAKYQTEQNAKQRKTNQIVGIANGFAPFLPSMRPTSFPIPVSRYKGMALAVSFKGGPKFTIVPFEVPAFSMGLNVSAQSQYGSKSGNIENVYGYFHNGEALGDEANMMDYSTDQDGAFERRSKNLGIPVSNSDFFMVASEGVGGAFRAMRKEVGQYRRNDPGASVTVSASGGFEFTAPASTGAVNDFAIKFGGGAGASVQTVSAGGWKEGGITDYRFGSNPNVNSGQDKPFSFVLSGDMGGWVDPYLHQEVNLNMTEANAPVSAALSRTIGPPVGSIPTMTAQKGAAGGAVNGQSTFIDFNYNGEFYKAQTSSSAKLRIYEKKLYIGTYTPSGLAFYDYNLSERYSYNQSALNANDNYIGEFTITNETGSTYVFGLPLYTKNEYNYSFDLPESKQLNFDIHNLVATVDDNKHFTNSDIKWLNGTEMPSAYASQFLLTQIVSPDYIDRTYDGPTLDDYGNYTRFNYIKIHSAFVSRSPAKGVSYSRGSLSRPEDDRGSVSYSEKEIYYLHSVVSKTHVAIFTIKPRNDGYGATSAISLPESVIKNTISGTNQLYYLEKIELFALSDCELMGSGSQDQFYEPKLDIKPIKTVNFEYSYELAPGVPTNMGGGTLGSGKLTLKRIWFTYNGKITAQLSPYEFDYTYPTSSSYPSAYSSFIDEYAHLNALEQNPTYDPANSDRWGCFRSYDLLKSSLRSSDFATLFPFVQQNPGSVNNKDLDPAAYCLKRIVLPGGGEIHVQYEQNDYAYVQNKRSMVMVPLSADTEVGEGNDNAPGEDKAKEYYLDLSSLGIDYSALSQSERKVLADELFEPILKEEDRLYFNFLYDLVGNHNTDDYTLQSTTVDQIEGFSYIKGYGFDSDGIYFIFNGEVNKTSGYTEITKKNNPAPLESPRSVCKDYYNNQRRGLLTPNIGPLLSTVENALSGNTISGSAAKQIADAVVSAPIAQLFEANSCKCMSPKHSMVRVQLPFSIKRNIQYTNNSTVSSTKQLYGKLGGGVRVKRILMYDSNTSLDGSLQGINAKPVLYGSEYDYTTNINGYRVSSGVATSEPMVGKYESALAQPIDFEKWSFSLSEMAPPILSGGEIYDQIGPVGESFYPGASVGYSKVTVRNIHSGKTGTGYIVHEFNTCKEYPIEVVQTPLALKGELKVGLGLYSKVSPYASQGYSIIVNGMHGTPKSVTTYGGKYSPDEAASGWTRLFAQQNEIVSSESVEYFQPGELLPVMGANGVISMLPLGRQTEMYAEHTRTHELTTSGSFQADKTVGGGTITLPIIIIPIPMFVTTKKPFNVSLNIAEKSLHTHVTVKHITVPTVVKKTTSTVDGIEHITENLAFDRNTGKPVLTKSYDDYKGSYFSQSFMASWHQAGMGQMAINQKRSFPFGSAVQGVNNMTVSGTGTSAVWKLQIPSAYSCEMPFAIGDLLELKLPATQTCIGHISNIDWVDMTMDILPSQQNPTVISGPVAVSTVTVLRSGFTNQLTVQDGGYLAHRDDTQNPFASQINGTGFLDATHPLAAAMNTAFNSSFPAGATVPAGSSTLNVVNPGSPIAHVDLSGVDACFSSGNSCFTLNELKLGSNVSANGAMRLNIQEAKIDNGSGPTTISGCTTPVLRPANTGGGSGNSTNSVQSCPTQNTSQVTITTGTVNPYFPSLGFRLGNSAGGINPYYGIRDQSPYVQYSNSTLSVDGRIEIVGFPEYHTMRYGDPGAPASIHSSNPNTYLNASPIVVYGSTSPTFRVSLTSPSALAIRSLVGSNGLINWELTGVDQSQCPSTLISKISYSQAFPINCTISNGITLNDILQGSGTMSVLPAGMYCLTAKLANNGSVTSMTEEEFPGWNYTKNSELSILIIKDPDNLPPYNWGPSYDLANFTKVSPAYSSSSLESQCVLYDPSGNVLRPGRVKARLDASQFNTNEFCPLTQIIHGNFPSVSGPDVDQIDPPVRSSAGIDISFYVSKPGTYICSLGLYHKNMFHETTASTPSYSFTVNVPACSCAVDPIVQGSNVVPKGGGEYEVQIAEDASTHCLLATPISFYSVSSGCTPQSNPAPQTPTATFVFKDVTDPNPVNHITIPTPNPLSSCWRTTSGTQCSMDVFNFSGITNIFSVSVPGRTYSGTFTANNYEVMGSSVSRTMTIRTTDVRPANATLTATGASGRACNQPVILNLVPACPSKPVAVNSAKYEYRFVGGGPWQDLLAGFNVGMSGNSLSFLVEDCGDIEVRAVVSNPYGQNYTNTVTIQGNTTSLCNDQVCACQSELLDVSGTIPLGSSFTQAIGKWYVNQLTGDLIYKRHSCARLYVFPCLKACSATGSYSASLLDGVVKASAATFREDIAVWGTENPGGYNAFETGERGNWRLHKTYTYLSRLNGTGEKYAQETGRFRLKMFDWSLDEQLADEWVLTSQVNLYSPNGFALEDASVPTPSGQINSSAHYGYRGNLMTMVAQNGKYTETMYESFENIYTVSSTQYGEDGVNLGTSPAFSATAHTGSQALLLNFNGGSVTLGPKGFNPNNQTMVRFWAGGVAAAPAVRVFNGTSWVGQTAKKVASSGYWTLYEATIDRLSSSWVPSSSGSGYEIRIVNLDAVSQMQLDDIRVQPAESEAVCYVYDKQQRLIAVFDDQHFGTLYQYNDEGILVRKLKETMEGIKTLSESFGHQSR